MSFRIFLLSAFVIMFSTLSLYSDNAQDAKEKVSEAKEYLSRKKYKKALESAEMAIQIDPEYAEAYFCRGSAHLFLDEYEKAIEDFTRTIELDPDYYPAYEGRLRLYSFLEMSEEAISDAAFLIETAKQGKADYYILRGENYAKVKKYEEAINDFTTVIKHNPKYSEAYLYRAFTYMNMGKYKEVLKDAAKVIKLNPENAYAYNTSGYAYFLLGKARKAIKQFNKAIKIDPGYDIYYVNRALAYRNLNKLKEAVIDLEKAHELNPENTVVFTFLASTYTKLEDYNNAKFFYVKAFEADPDTYFPLFFRVYVTLKMSQEEYTQTLDELASKMDLIEDEWEKSIAGYLLSGIQRDEFLEIAGSDNQKLCEAYFYIGVNYLAGDNIIEAMKYFELSKDTNVTDYVEYDFSVYELEKHR